MPARRQRPGFRLAIANDTGNDQVRVVESGAVGVRQSVAKLATFVNRARRFRRHMTWDPAWERELGEESLHPLLVLRDVRIDFAISALKICICDYTGAAMPWAGNIDHIQVVIPDQPIQMNVDEVQAGGGSPMAEQPGLDVLFGQGLLQKRVVIEVDLADGQVIGGPPIRIHQRPFLIRQRIHHRCSPG